MVRKLVLQPLWAPGLPPVELYVTSPAHFALVPVQILIFVCKSHVDRINL